MTKIEKKEDAPMMEAYRKHQIPQWYAFKPYFDWVNNNRHGHMQPCHIREMRSVALSLLKMYEVKHPDAFDKMGSTDRSDPFFPYDAYGEDKVVVSTLNQINEELTNMLLLSVD